MDFAAAVAVRSGDGLGRAAVRALGIGSVGGATLDHGGMIVVAEQAGAERSEMGADRAIDVLNIGRRKALSRELHRLGAGQRGQHCACAGDGGGRAADQLVQSHDLNLPFGSQRWRGRQCRARAPALNEVGRKASGTTRPGDDAEFQTNSGLPALTTAAALSFPSSPHAPAPAGRNVDPQCLHATLTTFDGPPFGEPKGQTGPR